MIVKIALGVFVASTSLAPLVCAQTRINHPLDGLATNEYWTVHDVLHSSDHWTDKTLVASLLLHEPVKQVVLDWKPDQPIPREADVILESQGKTIEARVDIANQKLEFWNEVSEVQAPITQTELDTMNDVAKKDPRVIAALKGRGITNLATVRCDMIPLTFTILPEQNSHRIGYGTCADRHGVFHSWGRAVEGLYIVADMTAEKIPTSSITVPFQCRGATSTLRRQRPFRAKEQSRSRSPSH
jgi:primary-amine oxidase